MFENDLARKLCRAMVEETNPQRFAALADLLRAVVKDDQEEIQSRLIFLLHEYPRRGAKRAA